ncbi:MAG TPA: polysaccharide deacetylase family protein [Ignavibacteriaceae bacterium]|nr:polysaccharide deacetylase family protein [Ignavibacteriaceae bacterium]
MFSISLLLTISGYSQSVALSFDDVPRGKGILFSGSERAQILLEKLKKENVDTVIFFCVGRAIDSAGDARIKMYSEAGHLIANHTYSHKSLDKISAAEYIADIAHADSILNKYKTYTKLFRFPYLHEGNTTGKRDSVRNAIASMNYMNGYVTIDTYDWYIDFLLKEGIKEQKKIDYEKLKKMYVDIMWDGIKFYDSLAQKVLGRSPAHVLLLHENDLAALFIDDLIDHIRKNNGRIISPIEAYQDPVSEYIPNVLMNNQGRIVAIAKEKGYKGELSHQSESEEFIENYFNTHVIIK